MTIHTPIDQDFEFSWSATTCSPPAPHEVQRHERDAQTMALVDRLRDCTQDEERPIRDELIRVNLPLAQLLARRYRERGEAQDDLEQVACLGLTEAAHRFDPTVSDSFPSYCVPTILGCLRRHFRDRGWTVRPPRGLQELHQAVRRARGELERSLHRAPSVAEIADYVGRSLEDVAEALTLHDCYSPMRLDRALGPEPDSPTLGELLPGTAAATAPVEARVMLSSAISNLGERDRQILHMRFFEGLTQREIGEHLGVTQMQISRVLARILNDLRSTIGPLEEEIRSSPEGSRRPAQPAPRQRPAGDQPRSASHDPREVRAWAASRQIPLPSRGRIPNHVWAEFESAC